MHKMLLLSIVALLGIGTDAANARVVPFPDVQQFTDHTAQTPLTSVRSDFDDMRGRRTVAGREEEVQAPWSDSDIQAPRGNGKIQAPRIAADPRDEVQAPYVQDDCQAPLNDSNIQAPHALEMWATA